MQKTRIAHEVAIDAPKQKVWEVLSDFGNVYRTSPNIIKSYLTSDQKQGVGTTRHCDFTSMGAQVEERITEWNDGESIKIDIYERKNMPMVADMKAVFTLKSDGDNTVLSGIFEYQMSNSIGSLINRLTMRKMNERAWVSFLAGIKHYVETGTLVEKGTKLNINSVREK